MIEMTLSKLIINSWKMLFLAFGAVVVYILVQGNIDDSKEEANPTCRSNWKLCADNSDIAGRYKGWLSAQVACKVAAEKKSKYGTPNFPSLVFSQFHDGRDYLDGGVALLIEDDARIANQYGAMTRTTVFCHYDLSQKGVVGVTFFAQ